MGSHTLPVEGEFWYRVCHKYEDTCADTHKNKYKKVTLAGVPHFFRLAVAAPAWTREHDNCDKTQEHKQNKERVQEKETSVRGATALKYQAALLMYSSRLFPVTHLVCLQRGVLLSSRENSLREDGLGGLREMGVSSDSRPVCVAKDTSWVWKCLESRLWTPLESLKRCSCWQRSWTWWKM